MAPAQLWLSVFEDPACADWPPSIEGNRWRVALTESRTLQGCGYKAPFRTSPVFPATSDFIMPRVAESEHLYFHFLCFDPAFPVLGRLIEKAPSPIRSGLAFTLGLASVLIITSESLSLEEINLLAAAAPRSSEIWHVRNSRVSSTKCKCSTPVEDSWDPLLVRSYDSLPLVSRSAVDEFVASTGLLLPEIAVHLPSEMATFKSLVKLVDELVIEMNYVAKPKGVPPSTLSEYTESSFVVDPGLGDTILQQATERIVQINAALSYLSTQALSGAVPILERRSIIRRHSLLGVGSAILALTRITRSIERAFAIGAVETILDENARESKPLPGLERISGHDPSHWSELSVSRWDGKVQPRSSYPKLPYFSGRLGYREGEYTISAALHSLAAGADPEWSLLTVTHEMVHGHVRNILAIIFQGNPQKIPAQKWKRFYERFATHVKDSPPVDENFIDSLRGVFLSYCCQTITYGSLTNEVAIKKVGGEIQLEVLLPPEQTLWSVMERELRNLSEILVHVLDLNYFYCSRLSAYIPLVWSSWARLPQVNGDLRQYLLRSLLVVAAKTNGTPFERYGVARTNLAELLTNLRDQPGAAGPVIKSALAMLQHEDSRERFFFPFAAGLILVDLANSILTSRKIRGSLVAGDQHLRIMKDPVGIEEWFDYTLPDDFVDDVVSAPAAYMADRLEKRLSQSDSPLLESDTVRLFLACCSHLKEGDNLP